MTDNRWPEIKPLLDRALDLDPAFRASYLDRACGEDLTLKAEVESYLVLEGETADLETPLLDLIAGRSPEYRAGQRMGPYRLDAEIARGGMGVVYEASRIEGGFEQKVAIKILRRGFDTGDFVRRFRAERQILAGLDHPHIARLFDGGTTEDGLPYLVMEPVNGRRLDHYCQEENLSVPARLELLRKICDAVHAAHQRLIVHCDLKPSNILVTADGTPKLLDFGIAKVLRQSPEEETRSLTLRLGTPGYSSPELFAGSGVTTGSDVYALGCLLHLLLTGKTPEPRTTADDPLPLPSRVLQEEIATAGSQEAKADARDQRQQVKGDLDAITLKAMAWDPKNRYTSADALSNDLDRHLRKLPVSAQPYSWGYIAGRLVRRRRRELAVGLVVALFALMGLGMFLGQRVRAEVQENRAAVWFSAYDELFEVVDPTSDQSDEEAAESALRALLDNEQLTEQTDRARVFNRLGTMFLRLEQFDTAEKAFERAVVLYRAVDPPQPKKLAASLNNLARVYSEEGRTQDAALLYEEALTLLSPPSPATAAQISDITHNLAGKWSDLGNLPRAEAMYRHSLPQRRERFGPRSMEVARSLNQLGKNLAQVGRYAEAEALYRESLSIREESEAESIWVDRARANLAALLNESGRSDQAIGTYQALLTTRLKDLGPSNLRVAKTQAGLASALLGRGQPGDLGRAQTLIESARQTVDTEGLGSDLAAAIDRHLAAVLLAQGDAPGAEVILRELIEDPAPSFQERTWRYQDLNSLLGASLTAQGRFEEARLLLENSWRAIEEQKGSESRWTREARERWEEWQARSAA